MTIPVFVYVTHKNGEVDDTALELLTAAQTLSPQSTITAVVTGQGDSLDKVCQQLTSGFETVWKIDHDQLTYPNAELVRSALLAVLPAEAVVLMAHDTFGMDLGPGLSIKREAAYLADVTDFEVLDGTTLKVARQEYGGMVSAHVACELSTGGLVATVRPGAYKALENQSVGGSVSDQSQAMADIFSKRRFVEVVAAEVGDVDITKSEVLVSVGRGIEDQDNIEIAEELAEAMGADLSCSRPIVDAKWLEKSRQVGTSGQTVKPKVYLALGISGSFQHLGGIKGAPFIVAINKNAKAPIFQVADVGIVDDLLDFVPELTEALEELKG